MAPAAQDAQGAGSGHAPSDAAVVPDLLATQAGGGEHASVSRRSRDAERDSAIRDAGLEVFRVTGYDALRPGRVVERVRAAYARAAQRTGRRGWMLGAPSGWPGSPTLDELLDHQDLIRELHGGSDPVARATQP